MKRVPPACHNSGHGTKHLPQASRDGDISRFDQSNEITTPRISSVNGSQSVNVAGRMPVSAGTGSEEKMALELSVWRLAKSATPRLLGSVRKRDGSE
jgi:hypothetical protein